MSTSHRIGLALGLLTMVLLAGGCAWTQPGSGTPGDAVQGRSLWAQSACVGCHGIQAEGSRLGPALANTPLTLREATSITRRGGPGMPEYPAGQVSDQDLRDMYAWWQNPVPAPTAGVAQDPWTQSACIGCHARDALGGSGPSLAGTSQPFADFQAVVRRGAQGMPAYSAAEISDGTLQAMYDWLQALAPVPAGQPAPWVQAGCAGCHGVNAEGALAPGLTGEAFSYDEFERVVRGGEEGMPAFSTSMISDADLQSLYDWLERQGQVPAAEEPLWVEVGCGACHGAKAEGASAPGLTGEDLTYDEFERVVRRGEEGMPAYSTSQIGDADLQSLWDWLEARGQAPALEEALWVEVGCGACHGAKAEGAGATALAGEDLIYEEFRRVVRGGEEGMPAYSTSQISDADLQRLYDWLMARP